MRKRIIVVLFAFAMLLSLLALPMAAGEPGPVIYSGKMGDDVYWKYDQTEKLLKFSGTGDMYDFENTTDQPWYSYRNDIITIVIGEGITSVGSLNFCNCKGIKTVTFPSTLERIGASAFKSCSSLVMLSIPDSVTYIGAEGFRSCSELYSVTVPDTLMYLGDYAFSGCNGIDYTVYENGYYVGNKTNPYVVLVKTEDLSVSSAEIAEGTKFVSSAVFNNASQLTSVTIPDSVISIGQSAFSGCTALEKIVIPDSVVSVGVRAFYGCTSLESVKLSEKLDIIPEAMFYNCSSLSQIEIPGSVKRIVRDAFYSCRALTSVTIPDGVEEIGHRAFAECISLTEVNIGKTLSKIYDGGRLFSGCAGLSNVNISAENEYLSYENGFLYNKDKTYLIDCIPELVPDELVIPSTVKTVGGWVFRNLTEIKSVTFPDGLETIGDRAFENCTGLVTVSLPDSVTEIGISAFYECENLVSVRLGTSLETIGSSAFKYCTKLYEVVNDSSVSLKRYLGTSDYGYVVKYAIILGSGESTLKNIDGYLFLRDKSNVNYLVAYTGDSADLVLPESCNGEEYIVYSYAFSKNNSISSAVIPDAVTGISRNAFDRCINLTSVIIGKSVTVLGDAAFYGCKNLATVQIPSSVVRIHPAAFYQTALTDINFMGTLLQWKCIDIQWDEFDEHYAFEYSPLEDAAVHCYCTENGHTEAKRTAKEATCTEDGTIEVYCSVCDEVISTERIPKGHSYEKGVCTVCGA
ncbi:MAG: leucine-rich repeat domain-containing protein, partial [Clostridia bacterium]|nr:leucine-rich repeat domain-containing protein [Clostridia bacterium]